MKNLKKIKNIKRKKKKKKLKKRGPINLTLIDMEGKNRTIYLALHIIIGLPGKSRYQDGKHDCRDTRFKSQ